jgi:hypothetical protein
MLVPDQATSTAGTLTIRQAGAVDERTLRRLAALDSQVLPRGPLLLAEVDGECLAAVAIDGTATIADPFQFTSGLTALLHERARQLRDTKPAAVRHLRTARYGV